MPEPLLAAMDKENPILPGNSLPIKKRKREELSQDSAILDEIPLTQPETKDEPAPSEPNLDLAKPLTLKRIPLPEFPPGFKPSSQNHLPILA